MLSIAIQDQSRSCIWEQELGDAQLNQGKPSYWADTWSLVVGMNLPGTNRFLIGADQAVSMHRWHRHTEFWRDAVIVLRDQVDSIDSLISELVGLDVWSADEVEHWRGQVVNAPTVDASSTQIRSALGEPLRRHMPITGLDSAVQDYIIDNDLYQ